MDFIADTAKLTINDAHTEDSGNYSCEIWNEVGQTESSFKVNVTEQKGKPKRTRVESVSVPNINIEEPTKNVSDEHEAHKPPKKVSTSDRKVSKTNNLDMIDEAGSKFNTFYWFFFNTIYSLCKKLEIVRNSKKLENLKWLF